MKKTAEWLKKNHWEFSVLFLILLAAALMRFYRIADYLTFLGDEGRDVLVVKRIIVDHKWTLLGPTASVGGFFLGPVYYYFMVPFLWLWQLDPVGPAVMVALFGVATVFLVWKMGRELFNSQAGLAAASLYCLSPLVIAYSRSSWNPNVVPFFALFYLWSLKKISENKGWVWWLVSGFLIGIGLQLHYLFTFMIPLGIVFLIVALKKKRTWKPWLIKGAGLVMGWSPFLLFEFRHRFPNTITLFKFVFQGEETGYIGQGALALLKELVFRLYARLVFYFPPPEQFYRYSKGLLLSWRLLIVVVIFSSLGLLICQWLKKKDNGSLLLLLWLTFGIGLFLFYQKEIYDYYFGMMFPLPFLLVGNFLSFCWTQKKIIKIGGVVLFVFLLWLNWFGRPFKFPANRQLNQTREIARVVFEKAQDKPYNFGLITGGNSDHAYRYFLELWGNPPVTIENPQADPERKTVTDTLLVVCEAKPCEPLGYPAWEIAGFGRAEIVDHWPVSVVEVYQLRAWSEKDKL